MSGQFASLLLFVFLTVSAGNAYYTDYGGGRQESGVNLLKSLESYRLNNKENRRDIENDIENWTGRWMPDRPEDPTPPPKVFPKNKLQSNLHEYHTYHGIPMGKPSPNCDDAQTNLTIDWDHSPVNHTCYHRKFVPDRTIGPITYSERIPKEYVAAHKCMYEKIEYDEDIPLYGAHRPLWPVYGEYVFLPKQRWLHSLEHGAVVMLYHPCANPLEIKRLRSLVTNCLWRHVITPYNLLDEDRPLALLTWGRRLTMSYVNPVIAKNFIQRYALRGPEQISDDGTFTDGLLVQAQIVSDLHDSNLCPNVY